MAEFNNNNIPISKIEVFVAGYIHEHFNWIYTFIIEYLIIYLNGDEGTSFCVPRFNESEDNQFAIAEEGPYEYPSEALSINSTFAMQFFMMHNPNRSQFVKEMKIYYDSSVGNIIKIWRHLCNHVNIGEVKKMGTYKYIQHGSKQSDSFDVKQVEANRLKNISKTEIITKNRNLNIIICPKMIKKLGDLIKEKFVNESEFYYYIDITTKSQIDSGQIMVFKIFMHDKMTKLGIINYDLHQKGTGQILYGIITSNPADCTHQNEYLWVLNRYMTKDELFNRFGIKSSELPLSSQNKGILSCLYTYKYKKKKIIEVI